MAKCHGDFKKNVLPRNAKRVLREGRILRLSVRDHRAFVAALDADLEPNEVLRRAARRHNERRA